MEPSWRNNGKTYTKKLHVHRLKVMLERGDKLVCTCCPAQRKYGSVIQYHPWKNDPCKICQEFAGLEYREGGKWSGKWCPCERQKSVAVDIAWEKIFEYEREKC